VRRIAGYAAAAFVTVLLLPAPAVAHLERPTTYPDPARGAVPTFREGGATLVVCKADSRRRIRQLPQALRKRNLELLPRCRYSDIQAAINAAASGTRILVLPGVYREQPSRAAAHPDLACAGLLVSAAAVPTRLVAGYQYQRTCPNDQNLIAIVGDSDGDGVCDDKCDLQIQGTARRQDVLIEGDRRRLNVIRADRADGVALRNITIQHSDFNNIYVIETNGFRLSDITSRWSREYGVLSFTSDHGLYEKVTAYGNGDSGVYPGSGPEGHCARYGIELRKVNSYKNNIGLAGTSGNGLWIHDSSFHHNATGLAFDSLYPGHPGMPQDCTKLERNRIYSNNMDNFTAKRDRYCQQAPLDRDPRVLCPTTPTPVGTGIVLAGGNGNIYTRNWIYDNWRWGVQQFWVPPFFRGDPDPPHYDTSNYNTYSGNHMGVRPDGRKAPNGLDFWWDEEGTGNCWGGNIPYRGRTIRSDPTGLPACPADDTFHTPDPAKVSLLIPCASWHPLTNPNPAGCIWLRRPPRPKR
jgi:hypothetical protein